MTVTHLLTEFEEAALAVAVEVGVLAEGALAGAVRAEATARELLALAHEGRRARERLLLANTGLVKTIARGELGMSTAQFPEVVQEGFVAMAEALLRYDHRRGRFGPYAAAWIRAGVRRAVATQCGRVEVPVKELARHFARRRTESELMQRLGRTVTAAEVPGTPNEAVRQVLWPAPLDMAREVEDHEAVRHLQPVDDLDALERLVGRLPPEVRQVIRRRFGFDGSPVNRRELAAELGLSEPTVRRMEDRGLQALRRGLARSNAA